MSLHDSAPITSATNSVVKRVRAVVAGREAGTLVLEGERLIQDALQSGFVLDVLLVSGDRRELAEELAAAGHDPVLMEASLLGRIGFLKTSPGILALAKAPPFADCAGLASLVAGDPAALVLVVCGVSDPVNLGALVRSAEAAGAAALVFVEGAGVSPWNPRALRGSMGSLLRLPVYSAANAIAATTSLAAAGFRIVCGATRGGASLRDFDWAGPVALWAGSEVGDAAPLDEFAELAELAELKFERVTIPMARAAESLNVAVANSLLLFAAGRAEPTSEAGSPEATR